MASLTWNLFVHLTFQNHKWQETERFLTSSCVPAASGQCVASNAMQFQLHREETLHLHSSTKQPIVMSQRAPPQIFLMDSFSTLLLRLQPFLKSSVINHDTELLQCFVLFLCCLFVCTFDSTGPLVSLFPRELLNDWQAGGRRCMTSVDGVSLWSWGPNCGPFQGLNEKLLLWQLEQPHLEKQVTKKRRRWKKILKQNDNNHSVCQQQETQTLFRW